MFIEGFVYYGGSVRCGTRSEKGCELEAIEERNMKI